MKGNEEASKSHIKYINAFDSKDGIGSSENVEDARKKEKKEFEARKRKRREARDIEKDERIALNEEKKKKAAQDRLEEERQRTERAVAQARKKKQKKEEEERQRAEGAVAQARKRRLDEQQHTTTMAVLEDDFVNAERIVEAINKDWLVKFEAIKAEWVRKNVSSDHLSENQLVAIGDVSHNCLLRARAGSGKTTVLKQKIDLLLRKTTIQPNEILALAFNTSAAKEIKRKIQKDFNHLTFSTSRTFHSLAHSIVIPEKKILAEIDKSLYVESLLKSEINPSVTTEIYEFFRREMAEMESLGSLLSQSDYYQMRRGSTHQTLKNDQVKSNGEKWIADFLFEHNISYVYERSWTVDATNKAALYHPDFSIAVQGKKTDVVLEHWGIDELSYGIEVPEYWTRTWSQYHSEMIWKRNFWRDYNKKNPDKPIVFIETSIRDMRNGREAFEAILKQKLKNINVVLIKLPAEILEEKVVRNQIPKLAKSMGTFIAQAKKACLTPLDLDKKLVSFQFKSEKEEIFVKLATRIYGRYQHALTRENRLDFDDVISKAVEKVHQEKGEISIQIDDRSSIRLDDIKWIMIDEYQDFSQLFYNLIDSLRSYNPEVKLFCVGDSWQAINGFAGSNLKFFDNFIDYFEDSTVHDLPDNYRSQSNIVDQANAFMKGKDGVPSVAKNHHLFRSPVYKYHANDVYINYDNRDPQKIHEAYKTRVFSKGEWINADASYKMARLLMLCQKIIKEHPLDTTSFMILSRTGNLQYAYRNLEKFKTKLRDILKPDINQFNNFDQQVQCLTAHGSKGLEADVVIVLNADERKFPLIHPDNLLNRILGVNIDGVFREEERLFYVAITRAKKELYLITEKDRESEFLDKIASELIHMPSRYPGEDTVAKQELPDQDSEVFGDDIPF